MSELERISAEIEIDLLSRALFRTEPLNEDKNLAVAAVLHDQFMRRRRREREEHAE